MDVALSISLELAGWLAKLFSMREARAEEPGRERALVPFVTSARCASALLSNER